MAQILSICLAILVISSFSLSVNCNIIEIEELEKSLQFGTIPHLDEHVLRIFLQYKPHLSKESKEFATFKNKLVKVADHNKNSNRSWTAGINKFSFIEDSQIRKQLLAPQNCSATAQATLKNHKKDQLSSLGIAPLSIDWREKGIVSAVQNQGSCGSCWTYATTGCLQSHWALKFGTTPNMLSTQQLVDCAGDFNNFGCDGGLPSQAFQYIRYAGGISSESAYPYLGVDAKCRSNPLNVAAYVPGGSVNITAYDETELQDAVGLVGPVAVAFEVMDDFFSYESGVYDNPNCHDKPDQVNHAVLAVGYGGDTNQNYWIIKNSWSQDWGLKGYFLMERGKNRCGVADCASYPDLSSINV